MLLTVFEGLPRSGKTTVISALEKILKEHNLTYAVVRPETIKHARVIKQISKDLPHNSKKRILLNWALKRFQTDAVLKNQDKDVLIMDRYIGSTVANDQYANRIDPVIVNWAVSDLYRPDIVFFLEAPYELIRFRGESEALCDEQYRVRLIAGFDEIRKKCGWITILVKNKTPHQIAEECFGYIRTLLKKN